MTLRINGHEVGGLELGRTAREYRVKVGAEVLVSGTNQLELAYAHHRSPSEVLPGATDDRGLAVGWDWLRIGEMTPYRTPFARGDGQSASVMLPNHLRLEYQLDVPAESSLVIESVRFWDDGEEAEATDLQVTVQTMDARTVEHFEIPGHVDLPISVASSQRLVLSFQARGVPGAPGGDAGIRLLRPAIRSASWPKSSETGPRPSKRPNILLYVIDTLRADHLGCYGFSSPTPRIDAFAEQATLFETAYAQSSWTKSSVASIMSGLLPRAHAANRRTDALPPGIDTLAERLDRLGYATAGFVTNPNLAPAFGFDQGFETYELLVEEDPQRGYVRSDALNRRAIEWLENRSRAEPFFLYMHSMDPHDPYLSGVSQAEPAEGIGTVAFMTALEDGRIDSSAEIHARLMELYDSEIAFNDQHFGELLDRLKRVGLYESTLIVLVSDHGEEFDDHGWWRHGKTLYREQLEIPLIVKWPGGHDVGVRRQDIAQHVDLLPTLMQHVGEESTSALHGRSLWSRQTNPPVVGYLNLDGRELESVVYRDQKLIRYLSFDRPRPPLQVFDLASDGAESRNLVPERPLPASFLARLLTHSRSLTRASVPARIDESLEEKLRALGYLR